MVSLVVCKLKKKQQTDPSGYTMLYPSMSKLHRARFRWRKLNNYSKVPKVQIFVPNLVAFEIY
jgi:hypothetical protein